MSEQTDSANADAALLDAVRAAFTGYEKNDFTRLVELMAPDFEFEMSDSLPYGGTFHGPAEFVTWWNRVVTTWEHFTYDAHDIIHTDAYIAVPVKTDAVHRSTRIRMCNEHMFLFKISDGKFVACRLYADTARGRDVVIDGVEPRRYERPPSTPATSPDAGSLPGRE